MIWGVMSSAGVGSLCFLKTNVTAPVYQDILEHFMLLSADQLFKDTDFIFQPDVSPAHTAKSTKSWLNDHGVGVLDRPANSPDLLSRGKWETRAPKKCRWAEGHCQRNLGFHYIYIFSRQNIFSYPKQLTLLSLGIEPMILALLAPCSTSWAIGKHEQFHTTSAVPQTDHLHVTPRRIEAVIKLKGAPTKYWVHIQ